MKDQLNQQDAAINQLCLLLENGDEAQRCFSARAIAQAKTPVAEPQLNACLYHEDPDVVTDAATALAAINAGNFASLKDVALNHPESDARIAALTAITQIYLQANEEQQQATIALLTQIATGRDDSDQLGMSGDWDDWWDLQLAAVNCLAKLQEQQNKAMFSELFFQLLNDDPEPELELALYRGLVSHSSEEIFQHVEQRGKMSQRRLARVIANFTTPEALAYMAKCLQHDDVEIQKIAITALAKHQSVTHLTEIIICLTSSDSGVQATAQAALNQLSEVKLPILAQLLSFAKHAPASSLPTIIKLLKQDQSQLSAADNDWLITLLDSDNIDLLTAVISYFTQLSHASDENSPLTQAQRTAYTDRALTRSLAVIQRSSVADFQRAGLIRQLAEFSQHAETSFPVLRSLLCNEETEASLRQPALEAMLSDSNVESQKWLKELLLGLASQEEQIAITEIVELDEAEKTPGQANLEALLAQHSEQFGETGSANAGFEDDLESAAIEIVNSTPSSTLAAIQRTNVEAALMPDDDAPDDRTLLEMIDDLDDEYQVYSNIVKDHLDTGERLSLNRKKIAKLPQTENKLLAIRALGQQPSEASVGLLLEALLGATNIEQHEIFQSLTRIAKKEKYPSLRNGLGAVGYTLHYGDDLCKQSAATFLAYMPMNKALPLILIGADDENEHVRVCCLNALVIQLESKKIAHRHKVEACAVLHRKLQDPAGGVRRLALQLLAIIDINLDLAALVELAVSDQECNATAAQTLQPKRDEVLAILANNIANYNDHRQPLAIKLTGELLAT